MNTRWKYKSRLTRMFAGVLFGAILVPPAVAQTTDNATKPAVAATTRPPYKPTRLPKRANIYYSQVWGVDSFSVKSVESGEIIRFAWRVLDANKAKPLNDKKLEPSLVDPRAGVSLVVPTMDKIGQLRQTATPEAGKSYWMAFSNKGRFVKRGDIVSVVIGSFKADGLVVQ
jgi:hypothetical protein